VEVEARKSIKVSKSRKQEEEQEEVYTPLIPFF
jgi:hypothetical protein